VNKNTPDNSLQDPLSVPTCDGSIDSKNEAPIKSRRACLSAIACGLTMVTTRNTFSGEKPIEPAAQFWLPAELRRKPQQTLATDSRSLSLFNTHTGHSLNVTFQRDGKFVEDALNKLNLFLRDHRANEAIQMDRMLFVQMWAISQAMNTNSTFEIISGYRSPKTNEMLRRRSKGVARNSLHMQGRAIDFRLRNVRTRKVRDVARALQAGGVGYYAGSDFVHIDTGRINHWG